MLGSTEGRELGELEAVIEGAEECMALGDDDLVTEGSALGATDGEEVGREVGREVGGAVGLAVGPPVGPIVGSWLGKDDGIPLRVGSTLGGNDGELLGTMLKEGTMLG